MERFGEQQERGFPPDNFFHSYTARADFTVISFTPQPTHFIVTGTGLEHLTVLGCTCMSVCPLSKQRNVLCRTATAFTHCFSDTYVGDTPLKNLAPTADQC